MSAYPEPYCDYCEQEGHTFLTCPARDGHDVDPHGDDYIDDTEVSI